MNQTIAFIGAGNMAEALIRGLLAGKVMRPEQIVAHDVRPERLEFLARQFSIRTAPSVPVADILVLAVKPQQMSEVLKSSEFGVQGRSLLISVAAGVTTARIERELGGRPRVVRVMPNTPALVGAGAAALCKGAFATDEDMVVAETILNAVGVSARVEESLMDAVTAVSGSGPAYVFYVTEALIKAGVAAGLSEPLARKLAIQTVFGAAKLMVESGEAPAELRRKVTSPGGTTEAAVRVLTERKLAESFAEAVQAARNRGRELSGN